MKLVYTEPFKDHPKGSDVCVGDKVITSSGEPVEVVYFSPPHKPSSQGKVTVKFIPSGDTMEYYVSVINAEWIDREDRK